MEGFRSLVGQNEFEWDLSGSIQPLRRFALRLQCVRWSRCKFTKNAFNLISAVASWNNDWNHIMRRAIESRQTTNGYYVYSVICLLRLLSIDARNETRVDSTRPIVIHISIKTVQRRFRLGQLFFCWVSAVCVCVCVCVCGFFLFLFCCIFSSIKLPIHNDCFLSSFIFSHWNRARTA